MSETKTPTLQDEMRRYEYHEFGPHDLLCAAANRLDLLEALVRDIWPYFEQSARFESQREGPCHTFAVRIRAALEDK